MPLAFVNHVYGVLDRATADAASGSELLRDLGSFDVRTVHADGETWTGRYLSGRTTYVEIFGEDDVEGDPVGSTGIALSPDRTGGLDEIERALTRSRDEPAIERSTRVRRYDDDELPWFDALSNAVEAELSHLWVMEYDPRYLEDPRSRSGPSAGVGDVSRQRYLAGSYDPTLPLLDLTQVEIAVTRDDLIRNLPLFRAAGLEVTETDDGARVHDGDVVLHLAVTGRSDTGLRRIRMSLSSPVPRREEALGSSTLVMGPDATATWTFGPRIDTSR